MRDAELVDYAGTLDCIHCGLCLTSCPTYVLTGSEPSSPRGRVHLMRSVAEGTLAADSEFEREMDFCLLCRACESACPSGVRFGALMEHTRFALAPRRSWALRLTRWLGFRVLLCSRSALRVTAFLGRAAQRTGLVKVLAGLAGRRGKALLDAPTIPPRAERARLPARTPARGRQRGTVAVLEGCVMPELFGSVNRASVSVLAQVGVEVRVPRAHVCCGSLHAHNGDRAGARALAQATIEAFEPIRDENDQPARIVVNSAGCGAHMREYAHLFDDEPWKSRAAAFASRVVDFSRFLAEPEHRAVLACALAPRPSGTPRERITWDDPCHLCHAQGVRSEPRALLDLLPGVERVEMEHSERCCGSAGIYALLRPADAALVLAPKLSALSETGATTLVTANPGCQMQWAGGLARSGSSTRVLHIAELLDLELARQPEPS